MEKGHANVVAKGLNNYVNVIFKFFLLNKLAKTLSLYSAWGTEMLHIN